MVAVSGAREARLFVSVLCFGAAVAAPVAAEFRLADADVLTPYLAEYELEQSGEASEPGIASVNGRLVLEFTGASCVGFTNTGRMVTVLDTTEGDRLVTDTRSLTVEHPDGTLTFSSETLSDGARLETSSGTARKVAGGVSVVLSEPREAETEIGGELVFPTEQVLRVLHAAQAGERFLALDVYDGTATGTLVYETATVMGAASTDPLDVDDHGGAVDVTGFAGRVHWPVTISHFERGTDVADSEPDFVLAFELFENGLSHDFTIDYEQFSMVGRLTRLEVLPPTECEDRG